MAGLGTSCQRSGRDQSCLYWYFKRSKLFLTFGMSSTMRCLNFDAFEFPHLLGWNVLSIRIVSTAPSDLHSDSDVRRGNFKSMSCVKTTKTPNAEPSERNSYVKYCGSDYDKWSYRG